MLPLSKRIVLPALVAVSITRHPRRHVVAVGAIQRQMVDHEHRLAVRRDHRAVRLADGRHPGDFLARRQIDHRNVGVETVANVKPFAIGADRRTHGRVTGRKRSHDFQRRRIDYTNGALRAQQVT